MHLSVSAFEAGGRRYFTGIIHDLSDQREKDVLREQTLFQAIFNQLPDALSSSTPTNKIVLCNPAVDARVRLHARGDHRPGLRHPVRERRRVRAHAAAQGARCASGRRRAPVTVRYRRKSGEAFPAETVASVLRDQGGSFVGFLTLNRDISQQVVQDEALRKSQRMEAIGQLTGGIAHDFNNLLTIITGNHELLEMELEDAEQRDLLARANNAALMGARLTNRLLTFARRRRLEPVVLDLNEQVLAMAELLRRTLGETIALGTLLAPHLWPTRADPSEVENAVLNLAINARDAMPAGGKLVIETAQRRARRERPLPTRSGVEPGDYVRLSVSDTGVGMTPRGARPRLRALLHHQGARQGHRPRPERDLRLRQAVGRPRDDLQRGRQGHDRQPLPAARRTAAASERRAPSSRRAAAPRPARPSCWSRTIAEVRSVTAQRLQNLGYIVVRGGERGAAIEVLSRGSEHRSRVQRRRHAGRHVGLRSGALDGEQRAGGPGPADVGLCRGRGPGRRDAGVGLGDPAQALYRRRAGARPAQGAGQGLGGPRTIASGEHSGEAALPGTVTFRAAAGLMLWCVVRALTGDAWAAPLERVDFESASLRLVSGGLIRGDRIEGYLAKAGRRRSFSSRRRTARLCRDA